MGSDAQTAATIVLGKPSANCQATFSDAKDTGGCPWRQKQQVCVMDVVAVGVDVAAARCARTHSSWCSFVVCTRVLLDVHSGTSCSYSTCDVGGPATHAADLLCPPAVQDVGGGEVSRQLQGGDQLRVVAAHRAQGVPRQPPPAGDTHRTAPPNLLDGNTTGTLDKSVTKHTHKTQKEHSKKVFA